LNKPNYIKLEDANDIKESLVNALTGKSKNSYYILIGYAKYQFHYGFAYIGNEDVSGYLISTWQWESVPKINSRGFWGNSISSIVVEQLTFNAG